MDEVKIEICERWKGSYVLLLELPRTSRKNVGVLGEIEFPPWFYAYVGSAMGGLRARLNHHLSRTKRTRWHIDYLLMEGSVRGVIYAPAKERLECRLAQRLKGVFPSFPGFGASDCRCPSHLFFCEELQTLREETKEIFKEILKGRKVHSVAT